MGNCTRKMNRVVGMECRDIVLDKMRDLAHGLKEDSSSDSEADPGEVIALNDASIKFKKYLWN